MSNIDKKRRRSASKPARPRRHVAPERVDRRVNFKEGLEEGPSGSIQPTAESVSDDSMEIIDEILEPNRRNISTPHEQLQHEFTKGIAKKNQGTAEEYWKFIQPQAYTNTPSLDDLKCDKDQQVCKGINFLVDEIVALATRFKQIQCPDYFNNRIKTPLNEELIRYIGCIAIGGPNGLEGWKDLWRELPSRQALVIGIIGRALEEHVFADLFFGGGELQTRLQTLQEQQVGDEGFSRTIARAAEVKAEEPKYSLNTFEQKVAEITAKLSAMLRHNEFVGFQHKRTEAESVPNIAQDLHSIVYHAASLSRHMRTASDVVYYWPPTFKDEEFEPSRMEAYNLSAMIEASPYARQKVNGRDRAILKEGRENESEAIVRVVCFPGLVAYRQGGGKLGDEELKAEANGIQVPRDVQAQRRRGGELPLTSSAGIRSKVLRKSLVLLTWGQQRLLTKEAGTSSHIDAVRDDKMKKYNDDYRGYVELYTEAQKLWPKKK